MTRSHAWLAAAVAAVALGTAACSSSGGGSGSASPSRTPVAVGGVVPVQLPGMHTQQAISPATTMIPTAISTDGKFLYVLARNGVVPVDLASAQLLPVIPTGDNPRQMAVTKDGTTGYVVNAASNSVTPISMSDNKPGAPITVGHFPIEVTFTPNGKTAYVGNGLSGTVTPVNVAKGKALKDIKVGAGPKTYPAAIAVTPDGKTALVALRGSNQVIPISTATNKAGKPITVGEAPFAIAISPDGKMAYVSNAGASNSSLAGQAKAVAASYGFIDGENGVDVTVNAPYDSRAGSVQVVIRQPQTLLFSSLFLNNVTIGASAVAVGTPAVAGTGCVC